MIRTAVLMASVALALALPPSSDAMCMSTQPFLAPASGASLPADPVIFLFVPEAGYGSANVTMAIDVASEGSAVTHQVEQVSHNPAITTYRISVAARATPDLHVVVKFDLDGHPLRSYEGRYRVGGSLPDPPRTERRLARPEYERSTWTCSYQSTWNLKPSIDAPAYRVEWAPTAKAYESGQRSSVVLPSRVRPFWRAPGQNSGESEPPALIELGHVDCMDHTLVWPGQRIWVGVWALLPDGSEVALTDEPIPLSKPLGG